MLVRGAGSPRAPQPDTWTLVRPLPPVTVFDGVAEDLDAVAPVGQRAGGADVHALAHAAPSFPVSWILEFLITPSVLECRKRG